MPITAKLFAHGGILRASYRHEARIAGDTAITTDAPADIFVPAFFSFVGQEWICTRRASRTDDIPDAALNGGDDAVW